MSWMRMTAGAIAIVTMAASALAQPDEKAKAALQASAGVIKGTNVVSMQVKSGLEGQPGIQMGGECMVTLLRGTASPGGTSQRFIGTIASLDGNFKIDCAIIEGKTVVAVDEPGKRVVEAPVGPGSRVWTRPRDYMIAPPWQDGEPYQGDLRAREIKFEADADVHGEACMVIRCVIDPKHTERLIFISKKDNLPRRYEQLRLDGETRKARVWEMWDYKTGMQMTTKDLEVPTPAGFKRVKEEAPAEPAKANPVQPQAPQFPVLPPGGPSKGADAAGFTLPNADGSGNVSLGALRGSVVVVGFWAPLVEQSKGMGKTLEAVASAYKDKPVKVVGIGCREATAEAAKKFAADTGASYPCVTGGDITAGMYNLRGFPSVCVIDAEGKVAGFIEGPVTKEAVAALIDAAMKPGAKN